MKQRIYEMPITDITPLGVELLETVLVSSFNTTGKTDQGDDLGGDGGKDPDPGGIDPSSDGGSYDIWEDEPAY